MKKRVLQIFMLGITMILCLGLNAQYSMQGTVTDAETGETLIGVSIQIKGTVKGTITDNEGSYALSHSVMPPYIVNYSFIGFETQIIEVTEEKAIIDVALSTQSVIAGEVVVSASRVEENIMQSPVTIEKIGLQEIKTSAAPDFYDEINNMKGVVRTQASLTFNTINTRGFATAGNTRFVQLQDGIDNAAPLLNFPTGNIVGISELDIKSVELVPGAASALYGPNAFNGILFMNSKEPWNYRGLSAQIKAGVTDGIETNPLQGYSFRYADAINDKFAYKINFSTFQATDWAANDYTSHRPTFDKTVSPTAANFDAVNSYGDDFLIPVGTGITRTGWREADLLDNRDATSTKIDGALHYRLNDNMEANISYKYGTGNSVYQGAERYALRDFIQQFAKAEINGSNWNIRGYGSFTDAGNSYNLTALGTLVNERLFPTILSDELVNIAPGVDIPLPGGWAVAANIYNSAFRDASIAKTFANNGGFSSLSQSEIDGFANLIANGSTFESLPMPLRLPAAYALINRASGQAIPDPNSQEFKTLVEQVRSGLFQQGGAGFIDNSRMYHFEGNYDFSEQLNDVIGLQVGANTRRYSLFTNGTVFREFNSETGKNERITIDEWGAYIQASKLLAEDRLKLTSSLRYDKNENFEGQISPRVSAVYSMGDNKQHNIRTSFQTGFRNPTTQGQYIFFPATQVLIGGTKSNADIVNEIDGSIFNIYEDGALSSDGETTVDLDYVEPEQLTSFEIGYKSIIGNNFFMDINYYRNNYSNFINQVSVLSTKDLVYLGNVYPAEGRWFPYTNVPIDFSSSGIDFGFRYRINKIWSFDGNYSFASLDFDSDKLVGTSFEGSNFTPGFNTPEHKFGLGVTCKEIVKNLSFGANLRWQDEFFYSSSFGNGNIPSYQTIDASMGYNVPSLHTNFKLGITNLLKENYVTNVGNPTIGRTIVLSITYDQFGR